MYRITNSSFAEFCLPYLDKNKIILDLGCGDGKDTEFFIQKGFLAIGYDKKTIKNTILLEDLIKKDYNNIGSIFIRFVIHSLTKELASKVLAWAYKVLSVRGKIYIECRSIKDDIYGEGEKVGEDEFIYDHYRRFIKIEELLLELTQLGFEISYKNEDTGLSKFQDSDPCLIRIIGEKNVKYINKATHNWLSRANAREGLIKVISILRSKGVNIWLEYGTLLGFIREGWFIEHDYDVDLGMKVEDVGLFTTAIDELRTNGIVAELWKKDDIKMMYVCRYKGVKIDIYIWHKKGTVYKRLKNKLPDNNYMTTEVDSRHYDKLNTIEIKKFSYYVPSDTIEYLKYCYGDDWTIPRVGPSGDRHVKKEETF